MNKKVKIIVPLLVAFSALTLAGCSGRSTPSSSSSSSSSSSEPIPGSDILVTDISLNRLNISLALTKDKETGSFVGETFQLEASTLPRSPYVAPIVYSSLNPAVASVSEDGLVTALSAGETYIVASSVTGLVNTTCRIFVYEKITNSAGNKIVRKIQKAQSDGKIAENLDRIYIRERFDAYLLKNGVLQNEDDYDQYMYVGKSEAYLRLGAKQEREVKVEGGSSSFTDWEWVFYTNEDYDTYIFHTIGNSKTYMVADSTSFVGTSRFTALCSILDSFFVSGSKIVTSQYDDIIGKDELGYVSTAIKCGSNSDSEIYATLSKSYPDNIAGIGDEQDYNIPAGTSYDLNIDVETIFKDNVQYAKKLIQEMAYKINNDKYSNVYDIEYEYHSKDVEFEYPNRDEYVKVADIFEL